MLAKAEDKLMLKQNFDDDKETQKSSGRQSEAKCSMFKVIL